MLIFVLGDTVVPRKGKSHGLKIFHRFHFSSALKRMSVIAGHTPPGSTDVDYIATIKGAPETIRTMVCSACLSTDCFYFRFVIFHVSQNSNKRVNEGERKMFLKEFCRNNQIHTS